MSPPANRPSNTKPNTDDQIRVVVPDEPPELTPEAARVLLRILLLARETLDARDPAA